MATPSPVPAPGNFEGPLALSIEGLEQQISDLVRSFAETHDLQSEIFYHDEPVWFVLKQEEPLTRSVEIAAFRTVATGGETQEQLFFIPDLCLVDEERLEEVAISPEVTNRHTLSILLDDLRSVRGTERKKKLEELLGSAWSSVMRFKQQDLSYSLGKIPSHT
jgi:hypothetical protein